MRAPLSILILISFMCTSIIGPMPHARADEFVLPKPGVMVHLSPPMNPAMLKGIKVHPDNPFKFDFILDKGESDQNQEALKRESSKLIKYFLASLTIPENDLWVNLSPYEKEKIIPDSFGLTEMGRDLLAEDYMLKQITASLIYPEDELGKKFWKRVYQEAAKKYGTTNIPINTFNKVWIVPQKAIVYENAAAGTAYVIESKLKVMLEEDYLSLVKHSMAAGVHQATTDNKAHEIGSQIVREIVIPQLTKEINENQNFTQLRQVYSSLILATWYKKKIKDSILSQVYADKNKVSGINIDNPKEKEMIYQQYLQAFKKGVYNYIKEDIDPLTQEALPRKYFSGGVQLGFGKGIDSAMTITTNQEMVSQATLNDLAVINTQIDTLTSPSADHAQVSQEDLKIYDESLGADKAMATSEPTSLLDLKAIKEAFMVLIEDRAYLKIPAQGFKIPVNVFTEDKPLELKISKEIVRISKYKKGIRVEVLTPTGARYSADMSAKYDQLVLGRERSANLFGAFVNDNHSSRKHLSITWVSKGYGTDWVYFNDLSSRGTFVNVSSLESLVKDNSNSLEDTPTLSVADQIHRMDAIISSLLPERSKTQDGVNVGPGTVYTDRTGQFSITDLRKKIKQTIKERNGRAGFDASFENGQLRVRVGQDESKRYQDLAHALEIAMNLVLVRDQETADKLLLEAQEIGKIRVAEEAYHNFKDLSAIDLIVGHQPILPLGERERDYFLRLFQNPASLKEYIDSDLMRDIILHVGNKSDQITPLFDFLRNYFQLVYQFENATRRADLVEVLRRFKYESKSYKFSKAVDLGRVKILLDGQWVLDESSALAMLDPQKTPFHFISSTQANSLNDFKVFVEGQANASNSFYIYHKVYAGNGRKYMVAARDGRLEIYYTSQTYSDVTGRDHWVRQEAGLGVIEDGHANIIWYAKPEVESAHDVNDVSNIKINELLKEATLIDLKKEDVHTFLGDLHVQLGLLFAPDGYAISFDPESGKPFYSTNGFAVDFNRYPGWISTAYNIINSRQLLEFEERLAKQAQRQRSLNLPQNPWVISQENKLKILRTRPPENQAAQGDQAMRTKQQLSSLTIDLWKRLGISWDDIERDYGNYVLHVAQDMSFYNLGTLNFITLKVNQGTGAITQAIEQGQLKLGELYKGNRKNIIFIPHQSAVAGVPLNSHTAAVITAMLDHQEDLTGSTVFDLGSGTGVLSITALQLGAKKVVLVENDPKALKEAKEFMTAQGYQEGKDFIILQADLSNTQELSSSLEKLKDPQTKNIVLANIGPWESYGTANEDALNVGASLKADLLINGGYLPSDSRKNGKQQTRRLEAKADLEDQGFNVQEIRLGTTNINKEGVFILVAQQFDAPTDEAMASAVADVAENTVNSKMPIETAVQWEIQFNGILDSLLTGNEAASIRNLSEERLQEIAAGFIKSLEQKGWKDPDRFKQLVKAFITKEQVNNYADRYGQFDVKDFVLVLQRMHTISVKNLSFYGIRLEVLGKALPLSQFIPLSAYSYAAFADILEKVGLSGEKWDKLESDPQAKQWLEEGKFDNLYQQMLSKTNDGQDVMAQVKAFVEFYKLPMINTWKQLMLDLFRKHLEGKPYERREGNINGMIVNFQDDTIRDVLIALGSLSALKQNKETRDLKVTKILGRGADGMALLAENAAGQFKVIKLNVVLPPRNPQRFETRIKVINEQIKGNKLFVRNNLVVNLDVSGGGVSGVVAEINDFIEGPSLRQVLRDGPAIKRMAHIRDVIVMHKTLLDKGFVNLDIRNLDNILIASDSAKLIDFGHVIAFDQKREADDKKLFVLAMVRIMIGQQFNSWESPEKQAANKLFISSDQPVKDVVFNRLWQILQNSSTESFAKLLGDLQEALNSQDKAQLASYGSQKGGIDLTLANMDLQIQNTGKDIKFNLDPAMLETLMKAPGFVPIIMNITPMVDLRGFLGIKEEIGVITG